MQPVGPYAWYEIWAEDVSVPPYIVVLFGNEQGDRFEAYDVLERRQWFVVGTYAEAQNELWEDEYTLVTGRTAYDCPACKTDPAHDLPLPRNR